jgi:hypothetical protein
MRSFAAGDVFNMAPRNLHCNPTIAFSRQAEHSWRLTRVRLVERWVATLERGVGEMDRTKQVVLLTDKLSLSPEQASALSGIELSSVREAVASGALVAHKHGVRVIILPMI